MIGTAGRPESSDGYTPDLPHPADILADPDYNPLEHLLEFDPSIPRYDSVNDSIAAIPDHPDVLLRWFPSVRKLSRAADLLQQFGSPLDEDRLRIIAGEQERQLTLMQADIPVVDHVTWVGPANPILHGTPPHTSGRPTIYSTVHRLDGRLLTPEDPEWNDIRSKIQSYVDRVGSGELCLWDTLSPDQYTLVATAAGRQAVYHDIEPLFEPREKFLKTYGRFLLPKV